MSMNTEEASGLASVSDRFDHHQAVRPREGRGLTRPLKARMMEVMTLEEECM